MAVRAPMAALAVQAGNKDTQMGFYKNDATAANNTSVNGIAIQGSSSPANIDNALRELAAQGRQFANDLGGNNTVGGTADAITITPSSGSISAVFDGLIVGFVAGADNTTTTPTANVGGLGAEPIKKAVVGAETAVVAGDIQSGGFYWLRWRSAWDSAGGAWQLCNPETTSTDVLTGATTAGSISVRGEGTATTNLQQGLAKAWANLNGTGTIALRDSFNIGATTDNGTGDYTYTFTSGFSNANYSASYAGGPFRLLEAVSKTNSAHRFNTQSASATNTDYFEIMTPFYGDLA